MQSKKKKESTSTSIITFIQQLEYKVLEDANKKKTFVTII